MNIYDQLKANRKEIQRIANKHGVSAIRLFGSVARGDAREDSDVDFLIEVEGATTPWFPGGLVVELESLLGRRVDVVEADAIRQGLREIILKEAVTL